MSSSSEGDEEYRWDEENPEEEEEEEEEHSLGVSDEDSDEPRKTKKLPGRTRRETKLRSVVELQSGLRRSKRATRNRINYRQYDLSESEVETAKPDKWHASNEQSEGSESEGYSMESQDSEMNGNEQELKIDQPVANHPDTAEKEDIQPAERIESPSQEEVADQPKRRFLDLNELAPGSGFDDGPNPERKDDDEDDM